MITTAEGTPQEVARAISQAAASQAALAKNGHAFAILIMDDSSIPPSVDDTEFNRLMSEVAADTVSFGNMDASREAMYTRMEGE